MSDLLAATAALVDIPSLSHQEEAMADLVEASLHRHPWLTVTRIGHNVVGRTTLGRAQRLVVAGHLDTVPPNGNETARVEGDTLWGIGASDMKSALAVMLEVAGAVPEPAVDVTWCFYAAEEVGRAESGLRVLWTEHPELLAGDAAVLGEPTGALVEAGCQGTMRVRIGLAGVRAHTARPFAGRNAIHRLAPILGTIASGPGRTATLDGCDFVEQLQVVAIDGGVAGNVVPDAASLTVNLRFAPDRTGAAAEASLRDCWAVTWTRPAVTAGRSSTRPTGRRPRSTTPCWPPWSRRPGRRRGPRWAGPTWPRSGSTASRQPTSGPVIRCWPTIPMST